MRIYLPLVSVSPCLWGDGDGDRSSDEVEGDDDRERSDEGGVM